MPERPAFAADLGVGVGLRVPHIREVIEQRPAVPFFEIISENFMVDGGPPFENLNAVLEHYRVVLHGVSLSLGAADSLDFAYLKRLRALAEKTQTPWFSDHLCWSSTGGHHFHDLLPMPYTRENARYLAERARIVQDFVGRPLALENLSSYVAFHSSEMPEWEFYREVVEQADCYMMLDVNNVFVSSVNHDFDPLDYLSALPLERVVQMHVAGHTELADGTLLDTHNRHVREEVWQLYAWVHERTGGVSTILEWDSDFLSLTDTLAEARRAEHYRHGC